MKVLRFEGKPPKTTDERYVGQIRYDGRTHTFNLSSARGTRRGPVRFLGWGAQPTRQTFALIVAVAASEGSLPVRLVSHLRFWKSISRVDKRVRALLLLKGKEVRQRPPNGCVLELNGDRIELAARVDWNDMREELCAWARARDGEDDEPLDDDHPDAHSDDDMSEYLGPLLRAAHEAPTRNSATLIRYGLRGTTTTHPFPDLPRACRSTTTCTGDRCGVCEIFFCATHDQAPRCRTCGRGICWACVELDKNGLPFRTFFCNVCGTWVCSTCSRKHRIGRFLYSSRGGGHIHACPDCQKRLGGSVAFPAGKAPGCEHPDLLRPRDSAPFAVKFATTPGPQGLDAPALRLVRPPQGS